MVDPIIQLSNYQNSVPKQSPVSEDQAAIVFRDQYKDRLLYCAESKTWRTWNGQIWVPDKVGAVANMAREVARDIGGGQIRTGNTKFATGIETFAKSDPVFARTINQFDADPFLLGTPNGTVDLKTGALVASEPSNLITKTTSISPSPTADCPLWMSFVSEATGGDIKLQRFLQQLAGYSCTGDVREQKLFFGHGSGGNGKGVLANTIAAILGDYAVTASMSTFEASKFDKHPTDLAFLRGARLVIASETEAGKAWAESRIKAMTGGDPISARFMRGDFFTYQPSFKLTIFGNHPPALQSVDEAMRRRICIVPFVHKPSKPDPLLAQKLRDEYPAILRWMIDGCLDWQANGLVLPPIVTNTTSEYFSDQDLFGEWLTACCKVEMKNPKMHETSKDLLSSWNEFLKDRGEELESGKTFAGRMKAHGFAPWHTSKARGFKGIKLDAFIMHPMTDSDASPSYDF